jgi:hypothetical protein
MNYETIILLRFVSSTLIGFLVSFVIAAILQRTALKELVAILLALSVIGACAGIAGGMSRVGAVGSIIPAFLGLLGGLSIYLFGIDRSKGLIASFGASALSISLIVSYTMGASYRSVGDDHRDIRGVCAQAYIDPKLLSDETAFKRFRDRMGDLCDNSMNWNINK